MTLLECGLCTAPLICLVFSACHPKSPSGERASAHDIAQINALRDQFVAAINAGDAAELVKVYTDDAILIARRLSGFRRQEGHPGSISDLVPEPRGKAGDDGARNPDLWRLGLRARDFFHDFHAEGKPVEESRKYLVIFKRLPDGSWKVHRDTDSSNG